METTPYYSTNPYSTKIDNLNIKIDKLKEDIDAIKTTGMDFEKTKYSQQNPYYKLIKKYFSHKLHGTWKEELELKWEKFNRIITHISPQYSQQPNKKLMISDACDQRLTKEITKYLNHISSEKIIDYLRQSEEKGLKFVSNAIANHLINSIKILEQATEYKPTDGSVSNKKYIDLLIDRAEKCQFESKKEVQAFKRIKGWLSSIGGKPTFSLPCFAPINHTLSSTISGDRTEEDIKNIYKIGDWLEKLHFNIEKCDLHLCDNQIRDIKFLILKHQTPNKFPSLFVHESADAKHAHNIANRLPIADVTEEKKRKNPHWEMPSEIAFQTIVFAPRPHGHSAERMRNLLTKESRAFRYYPGIPSPWLATADVFFKTGEEKRATQILAKYGLQDFYDSSEPKTENPNIETSE